MSVDPWSFVTYARPGQGGAQLADLAPHLSKRRLEFRLNQPPKASGVMSLDSPRADVDYGIMAGVHEMRVIHPDFSPPCVFRLTDVDVSLGAMSASLGLEWAGIDTYLRELQIDGALPLTINTAQSAHAWKLINDAQTNKSGTVSAITRGAIPSTDPVKSKTYDDRIDVLSAIEQLAARSDGFDFAFDASRAFNCFYPYRGADTGIVFEHGKNVRAVQYRIAAGPGAIASDVTVAGNTNTATAANTDTRTQYGRREALLRMPNAGDAGAVLQQYADAHQVVLKEPIFVPRITIDADHPDSPWGSYWLGDRVKVRARWAGGDFVNVNGTYRIIAITVDIDEIGHASVELELASILPLVVNRATLQALRKLATPGAVTDRTFAQRIAAIEAQLSAT